MNVSRSMHAMIYHIHRWSSEVSWFTCSSNSSEFLDMDWNEIFERLCRIWKRWIAIRFTFERASKFLRFDFWNL